jgi:hypothetical protein
MAAIPTQQDIAANCAQATAYKVQVEQLTAQIHQLREQQMEYLNLLNAPENEDNEHAQELASQLEDCHNALSIALDNLYGGAAEIPEQGGGKRRRTRRHRRARRRTNRRKHH